MFSLIKTIKENAKVVLPVIFNFCLRYPESELCICVLKCTQDRFVELYLVVMADLGGETSWEQSTFSSLPECSGKFS